MISDTPFIFKLPLISKEPSITTFVKKSKFDFTCKVFGVVLDNTSNPFPNWKSNFIGENFIYWTSLLEVPGRKFVIGLIWTNAVEPFNCPFSTSEIWFVILSPWLQSSALVKVPEVEL